jgi:hypothetical protein
MNKPVVPEETCPYIDMALDLIDKSGEQEDKGWRLVQLELAKALIEYVRESNGQLRANSKYWYGKSKRTINKE